jgi:predicted HicB family RNase H-like nuclease
MDILFQEVPPPQPKPAQVTVTPPSPAIPKTASPKSKQKALEVAPATPKPRPVLAAQTTIAKKDYHKSSTMLGIRLSKEMAQLVKARAAAEGKTVNAWMAEIVSRKALNG